LSPDGAGKYFIVTRRSPYSAIYLQAFTIANLLANLLVLTEAATHMQPTCETVNEPTLLTYKSAHTRAGWQNALDRYMLLRARPVRRQRDDLPNNNERGRAQPSSRHLPLQILQAREDDALLRRGAPLDGHGRRAARQPGAAELRHQAGQRAQTLQV